jgi:uncharacterized protein
MKKILFILFLLMLPIVAARHGEMPLLAVKETEEGLEGSTANLILDIEPGKGRVFLETVPLSKLDTQISTRFAKEIACDFLDEDCDRYDFFYTIKSDSSIVGGPSASAAISVLTSSLLEGIKINNETAMTGTINSGGLIGPVGGLKEKIDAAVSIGIKKVIIPKGESIFTDENNETIDLREYAQDKGIELFEVADLNEALYLFSGKRLKEDKGELIVNEVYMDVMNDLAVNLCNRSKELERQLNKIRAYKIDNETKEAEEKAVNFTEKGRNAFEQGKYYSSASYCFGANIRYRFLILKSKELEDFETLKQEIEKGENEIDKLEIKTITDLEAYMIIKERLKEAKASLNRSVEKYKDDEDYINDLAYSIERLYTAHSWSEFIGVKGKEFIFDRESLEESCSKKISEVEERYQFAKLLLGEELIGTKREFEDAQEDYENRDYELCLFRASKAKAEVDTILSVVGVKEEQIDSVLDNKLNVVKNNIIEQQENGVFPILGYSYYEYAGSLKDEKYSALLYSGYALELSNLDMYFKEESKGVIEIIDNLNKERVDNKIVLFFIIGLLIGLLIGLRINALRKK